MDGSQAEEKVYTGSAPRVLVSAARVFLLAEKSEKLSMVYWSTGFRSSIVMSDDVGCLSIHLQCVFLPTHEYAVCKSLGFLLQVHSIEMLEHRWRVTAVVYAFIVVVAQRTLKCCLDHSNSPTNQEAGFTCGSVWDFGPFSLEVAGLFWLNYINAISMNGMKKLDLQSWASEACLIDWVHCEKNPWNLASRSGRSPGLLTMSRWRRLAFRNPATFHKWEVASLIATVSYRGYIHVCDHFSLVYF